MESSKKYDFKIVNDEEYKEYLKAKPKIDDCAIDYASGCERLDRCGVDFT